MAAAAIGAPVLAGQCKGRGIMVKILVAHQTLGADGFEFYGLFYLIPHSDPDPGMTIDTLRLFMDTVQRETGPLMIEGSSMFKGSNGMALPAAAAQLPPVEILVAGNAGAVDGPVQNRLARTGGKLHRLFQMAFLTGHPGMFALQRIGGIMPVIKG